MNASRLVEWGTFGHIFHVHWHVQPCAEAMELLVPAMSEAHRKVGRRMLYLATHTAYQPPTKAEERAWAAFGPTLARCCEHSHVVVDTAGIRGAILRSAINCALI